MGVVEAMEERWRRRSIFCAALLAVVFGWYLGLFLGFCCHLGLDLLNDIRL